MIDNAEGMARTLNVLLATLDALCLKTRGFTFNISGPDFYEYHSFFNLTVDYLKKATYDVGERVRSLDEIALYSLRQVQKLSKIPDMGEALTAPEAMVAELLKDYHVVSDLARKAFQSAAKSGDAGTIALTTGMTKQLEHFQWELRVMSSKVKAQKSKSQRERRLEGLSF